jgi:hypothetical protein
VCLRVVLQMVSVGTQSLFCGTLLKRGRGTTADVRTRRKDRHPGMAAQPEPAATHAAAGFTGRFVAGLRAVESEQVAQPLLKDPLAKVLAGQEGLQLAEKELGDLVAQEVLPVPVLPWTSRRHSRGCLARHAPGQHVQRRCT